MRIFCTSPYPRLALAALASVGLAALWVGVLLGVARVVAGWPYWLRLAGVA